MGEDPFESLKVNATPSVSDDETNNDMNTRTQRPEALLIDDGNSVDQLIGSEVKPVQQQPGGAPWQLLLLVVLVVIGAGCVFVLVKFYQQPQLPPPAAVASVEERRPMPVRVPQVDVSDIVETTVNDDAPTPVISPQQNTIVEKQVPEQQLYSVVVGPFINATSLRQGQVLLEQLGLQPEQQKGRGLVHMVRLQEGVYPASKAGDQLKKLRKYVKSAFLLPQDGKKALYAGSFVEIDRALKLQQQLSKKQIMLKQVDVKVEMAGTMLVALEADEKTAQQLAELIISRGLNTRVTQSK